MTYVERCTIPCVSVALPITLETEGGVVGSGTIEHLSDMGILVVTEDQIPLAAMVRIIFNKYYEDTSVELCGYVIRSLPLGQYGVAVIEVGTRGCEMVRQAMMRTL